VYELPFADNSFDAAFAHGVLEHPGDPMRALVEIRRVLNPGGIIGVRSPDYTGHVYSPTNPIVDESLALIERFVQLHGGSRRIGGRLRAMLRDAGFVRVKGSASVETNGTPESTRFEGEAMAGIFAEGHYHDKWISLGWVDDAELQGMASAWLAWGDHPDAIRATMWCEAVGWKE
jgi:SAM-dependent methyltransferase